MEFHRERAGRLGEIPIIGGILSIYDRFMAGGYAVAGGFMDDSYRENVLERMPKMDGSE
jgi:hypothetical protein